MEKRRIYAFFFIGLFLLLLNCTALDTISADQAIKDGETIISDGEMYELGFFRTKKSKNRYLGIWYKKISVRTVVWVANRDTPINDTSGMFKVSKEGNLLIFSGGNTPIWSSNSTVSVKSINQEVAVQLLDTGNLVVWDHNSTNNKLIWQSFDHPCDTLLPGMKLGKDLVTGVQSSLRSWKSPDDPSIGMFTHTISGTEGYPQFFTYQGDTILSRVGPWNGLGFSGFPTDTPDSIYSVHSVYNHKELYNLYELRGSVLTRLVITWDGKVLILHWIERTKKWVVYSDLAVDSCGRFALCGPYGSCSIDKHPPCSCIEGFEPRNPKEWAESDWSSGCKHKKPMNCGNGFRKFTGVKIPDTRRSSYNYSMTLEQCEMACKMDCSCTAYANIDIRNGGNGCLQWFHDLIDIREYDTNQSLYIRMDASDLQGRVIIQSLSSERKGILLILLSVASVVIFLSALAYACKLKKKRPHMSGQGNQKHDFHNKDKSLWVEQLDGLQYFSLRKVVNATDNFSVSHKIGEGGFGPVYKGVLDGQEVAVKRLSETSRQGLEEFKNEVVCIAKLQHRNLVKLLGYCIHKSELILIYEFLANKSLDFFLFDETRSLMLDWPKRAQIIHGIARGILYLHQDSRLQIIHRDLKASNILLDCDMNPKISDFGLARTFIGCDATAKTKKVVGTFGYIPPEYAVHGHFSVKSDVFSFGVLMLEIISGKKNREFSHENHSGNLLGHAWKLHKENESIELMSASLRVTCIVPEVLRFIHVALLCVQNDVEDRPTMLSVVLMLVSQSVLPEPKQPAFYTGKICKEIQSLLLSQEYMITNVYAR